MLQTELQKRPFLHDALITLFFGIISIALSNIQFHIPGVGNSNLREIPLLICLFYLRNFSFVFILGVFTIFNTSTPIADIWVYVVHLIPLLIVRGCYKAIQRSNASSALMGLVWMAVTVAYYLLFMLPMVVFVIPLLLNTHDKGFWSSYLSILPPMRFEVTASALVTGLYLMQMDARRRLMDGNKNLEYIVEQRTRELSIVNKELQALNEELIASNESVNQLNQNLEQLVKERTDKINHQLDQLKKYAFMNSHELRAPLARMLGLLNLLKREKDQEEIKELLHYLHQSSTELDNVIRAMNRLLEREILPDEQIEI